MFQTLVEVRRLSGGTNSYGVLMVLNIQHNIKLRTLAELNKLVSNLDHRAYITNLVKEMLKSHSLFLYLPLPILSFSNDGWNLDRVHVHIHVAQ